MEDTEEMEVVLEREVANLKLPDPCLLNYYRDYESRVYWIEGEIGESILDLNKMIINYNIKDKGIPVEERQPIKIYIASYGGLLEQSMSLINLIGISKTPIYTINACYAYSAASLILLSGHKRYAMPGTKCLFHSGSGGTVGTYDQVQAASDDYKKLIKQVQDYILSRTKIDTKLFNKKKSYDWYLSTEEMLQYGVVEKIVDDLDEVI